MHKIKFINSPRKCSYSSSPLFTVVVNLNLKISNGKFQKCTIHKFYIACRSEQSDEILLRPPPAHLEHESSLCLQSPLRQSLSSHLGYQISCPGVLSACVQVTLTSNVLWVQGQWCWQFGHAREMPHIASFKWKGGYSTIRYCEQDHIRITFMSVYCYNCSILLLVIIVNRLLCPIYKLNFIIAVYV